MHLGTMIYTFFCGVLVGRDACGNRYYKARRSDSSGVHKRWVIYQGVVEPTKVPPEWHVWLHYITDYVPELRYRWQREHLPNCTGTDLAYRPPGHASKGGKRAAATGDYQPWKPE